MTAPVAGPVRKVLTGDRQAWSPDHAFAAVFALTGALVASRSQRKTVGVIFIACLTAGGGRHAAQPAGGPAGVREDGGLEFLPELPVVARRPDAGTAAPTPQRSAEFDVRLLQP